MVWNLGLQAGFYLKSIGDNSFSCQKLGKIVVTILAGEGAEEVLPSVLLSLSGDDGYRKNAATSAGAGFSFNDLFPGSFYLRPLLKVTFHFIFFTTKFVCLGNGLACQLDHKAQANHQFGGVQTVFSANCRNTALHQQHRPLRWDLVKSRKLCSLPEELPTGSLDICIPENPFL
jgi:hypothetical protein